jgi:hypothetical protein
MNKMLFPKFTFKNASDCQACLVVWEIEYLKFRSNTYSFSFMSVITNVVQKVVSLCLYLFSKTRYQNETKQKL